MSKRLPYWTCPDCGDHNDHGTTCDCKKTGPKPVSWTYEFQENGQRVIFDDGSTLLVTEEDWRNASKGADVTKTKFLDAVDAAICRRDMQQRRENQ